MQTFFLFFLSPCSQIIKSSSIHRQCECLCRLIEECWDPNPAIRPTFLEIIIRLDKLCATCSKQGRWKDNFKLRWYFLIPSTVTIFCRDCIYCLRLRNIKWHMRKFTQNLNENFMHRQLDAKAHDMQLLLIFVLKV